MEKQKSLTILPLIITAILLSGCSSEMSDGSSNSSIEDLQSQLDDTQQQINELDHCNKLLKLRLSEIGVTASRGMWESYNTMGDALSEIDDQAGSDPCFSP